MVSILLFCVIVYLGVGFLWVRLICVYFMILIGMFLWFGYMVDFIKDIFVEIFGIFWEIIYFRRKGSGKV